MGHLCSVVYCLIIVLHLIPVLKDEKRTGLLRFVTFEKFNDQCTLVLASGDYLSLDETLYPM